MLVIETWDGHNINDDTNYKAGFSPAEIWGLPKIVVSSVPRTGAWPVFGSLQRGQVPISVFIAIEGAAVRTLRAQLLRWFDPEDETPKELAITDDGTLRPRYVEAICQNFRPVIIGDVAAYELFRADLVVSGDVRWRGTSAETDVWNLTASAETNVVANSGEDDVYPIYRIKPTTGKTGGYDYRRWVPVKWRSENAGPNYPVRALLDTDALVTAVKMQADGDDLRVLSDGIEIDRWLNDMNTVSTDIWFSLDFSRAPTLLLKTAIAGAGAIDSIEFTDEVEVSLLPESGIIYIGTEAFVYTARSLIDAAVTGITRAAKGTVAGAHNIDDVCYWIQHDVYIVYGNAAATAPTRSAGTQPAFELDHSSDASWVYEWFGERAFPERPGSWGGWGPISVYTNSGRYTKTQRTIDNDISVLGAWRTTYGDFSQAWELYNPCGIVNAAWVDGLKRAEDITLFSAQLRYGVRGDYYASRQAQIAAPAAPNNWEAWNEAAAGADWEAANTLAIVLWAHNSDVEVSEVTVSLLATEVPVIAVGSEQGNYELSCTITNQNTGEAITLEFVMDLNSELEIDTYNKTITWLDDDSRQYQVISFSTLRRQWLRLEPGNNTLRFDDVGTGNVTLTTVSVPRYY